MSWASPKSGIESLSKFVVKRLCTNLFNWSEPTLAGTDVVESGTENSSFVVFNRTWIWFAIFSDFQTNFSIEIRIYQKILQTVHESRFKNVCFDFSRYSKSLPDMKMNSMCYVKNGILYKYWESWLLQGLLLFSSSCFYKTSQEQQSKKINNVNKKFVKLKMLK